MYCHQCGAKNEEMSLFCSSCGTKLIQENITDNKEKIASSSLRASEVLKQGVSVGSSVIKKGHGLAFKIGVFTAVVAVVLALVNFYFSYMISSPDGVVRTFMEASDKLDYNAMVSCFDDTTQDLFSAAGDLTMGFIGSATGIHLDFDSVASISSAFGDRMITEEEKCHATNFKVESIEGEKLSAFVSQFGTKIKSIGNLLGSRAVVSFEVDNKSSCVTGAVSLPEGVNRVKYQVEVKHTDSGWKIPGDMKFEYVGAAN